jgi:predicted ribosome quality control (RQC) complex YloA/Tae2 family protein
MKIEDIFIESINKSVRFLIGTSAKVNFNIIDVSDPNDLWFHARDYSSCHVIAEMPIGVDNTDIIKIGSELCIKHTNKLKSKNKIYIIYDHIRNIKKTKNIGEVLINDDTIKKHKYVLNVTS